MEIRGTDAGYVAKPGFGAYRNYRPDIADIVEAYLTGPTYRDLVNVYHSSPLRINQKIRDFLEGCPNWRNTSIAV